MLYSIAIYCYMLYFYFLSFIVKHFVIFICDKCYINTFYLLTYLLTLCLMKIYKNILNTETIPDCIRSLLTGSAVTGLLIFLQSFLVSLPPN